MQTLDVVNDCFAAIGELPITSLAGEPVTLIAAATAALDKAMRQVQSDRYWFNTEIVTFTPVAGIVTLTADIINVDPLDSRLNYVQRQGKLYDADKATYTLTDTTIECRVLRLIPLVDLPPIAADLISLEAQIRFASTYASSEVFQMLQAQARAARVALNKENVRNAQVNLLSSNLKIAYLRWTNRRWPRF